MNKNIVLLIAATLIGVGIFKPDITNLLSKPDNVIVDNIVVITPPADEKVKKLCEEVIKAFGSDSDRKADAKRLSSLYMDMSNLIALDGENEVIKNTNEIRQANAISGVLLQLDLKGKYPNLAEKAKNVIVFFIGDDDVLLSTELRSKASEGFRALSWACNEATK